MKVQLVFFGGCPNVAAARRALARALEAESVVVAVEEIDSQADNVPDNLVGWGSPTILINGSDVAGAQIPNGASCRLYENSDNRGVPSDGAIRRALREGQQ